MTTKVRRLLKHCGNVPLEGKRKQGPGIDGFYSSAAKERLSSIVPFSSPKLCWFIFKSNHSFRSLISVHIQQKNYQGGSKGFSSCGIKGRLRIVQYRLTPTLPFSPEYWVIQSTKLCQPHLLELHFLWNSSEWNRSSVSMLGKLFSSWGHQWEEKKQYQKAAT